MHHHGHCCQLKHHSLPQDIKVFTTRTSCLSLMLSIHCSSFIMENGANQGFVQSCALPPVIHSQPLCGETELYLIGSHNVQLDPNTLACNPLQIHSQSIKLPAIKYHTAMPIDTACWHGLILLGGLTKDFQ